MTNDYFPATGSDVAFVVAYLHSLPVGDEVGTGVIAEATDIPISNIVGLTAPVTHGFIKREKIGARYLWSRGPTQVPDEFIAAHPTKRHVDYDRNPRARLAAMPSAVTENTRSLSDRFSAPRVVPDGHDSAIVLTARNALVGAPQPERVTPQDTAPVSTETAPPLRYPKPVPPALRAGIWSDGSLAIERNGRIETYTPEETQYLLRFLTRTLLPRLGRMNCDQAMRRAFFSACHSSTAKAPPAVCAVEHEAATDVPRPWSIA